MNIVKLKKAEIILQELLKIKGLGLSFEINLNLFRILNLIEDWEKRKKLQDDGFLQLDKEGKKIKVLVNKFAKIVKDEKGLEIPFNAEREVKNDENWGMKFDPERLTEKEEADTKMLTEELTWEIVKLPKEIILEMSRSSILEGINYSILIGTIIDEK